MGRALRALTDSDISWMKWDLIRIPNESATIFTNRYSMFRQTKCLSIPDGKLNSTKISLENESFKKKILSQNLPREIHV